MLAPFPNEMNRELLTWYRSLSRDEKNLLQGRAASAPVLLRLLRFLEECPEPHFTTLSAVRALYPEEIDQTPFPKLRNRFFKIRKELLTKQTPQVGGPLDFPGKETTPEIRYLQLRERVHAEDADTALRGLRELSRECRVHNWFELYPQVLQERIYGLLLTNDHGKVRDLLDELEEASDLQHSWNQMHFLYRRAYALHHKHTSFTQVRQELTRMKKLADRYPDYPRFQMAYLLACLTFETTRVDCRPQVLGRYFSQLEELLHRHPEIPIFYAGRDHRAQAWYQIEQFRLNAHFLQGYFEEAYQSLLANLERRRSGQVNRPLAENDFRNKIKLELITRRFQEALQTARQLIAWYKSTGRLENVPASYKEMAQIYIYAFPELVPDKPEQLLRYLDEKMKSDLQQTGKDSRDYADTLTTRTALLLISRKYREALEGMRQPVVQSYYGKGMYEIILSLYELPEAVRKLPTPTRNQKLNEYLSFIQDEIRKTTEPLNLHLLGFIEKIIRYFISQGL